MIANHDAENDREPNRITKTSGTTARATGTRRARKAEATVTINLWTDKQDQSTDIPWATFDIPEGWSRGLLAYANKNGITASRAFEIAIEEYLAARKTENAIAHLQSVVGKRFGTDAHTETGAGTLTIAHDRVELTSVDHRIVGHDLNRIVAELEVIV